MSEFKSVFKTKRNKQTIIDVCYRLDSLAQKIGFQSIGRSNFAFFREAFEEMFAQSKMNEGYSSLNDFFSSFNIRYLFDNIYPGISNNDLIANIEVLVNLLYEHSNRLAGEINNDKIFIKACESYLYENGYKITLDASDNLYKVVQSNVLVDIMDINSEEMKSDFLDFYSYKNTHDLNIKRKILFDLANKLITVESKIIDLFSQNLKSELFKYANKFHIRHPNRLDGKDCELDIKNLTDEELLDWYNFIYPLFLNVYNNVSKLKKVDLGKKY